MWNKTKDGKLYYEKDCECVTGRRKYYNRELKRYTMCKCKDCNGTGKVLEKASPEKPEGYNIEHYADLHINDQKKWLAYEAQLNLEKEIINRLDKGLDIPYEYINGVITEKEPKSLQT